MNSNLQLITELIQRFVEDPETLSDADMQTLVAGLREHPEYALQLRDQLQIDDLLSQQLTHDRTHFAAQVNQRIDDFLSGEDELNLQAQELRRLALSNWNETPSVATTQTRSTYYAWGAAIVAIGIVVMGVSLWQIRDSSAKIVHITHVNGKAVIKRPKASDRYAQPNLSLHPGDRLVVQHDASLDLNYSDGTTLRVNGGSVIHFPSKHVAGKELYLDRGTIAANITAQPAGKPMIFQTPHAEAIVRGTELYLQVRNEETELEVAEGKVEFVERKQGDTQFIVGGESAIAATAQKIVKQNLRFPTSQDGLLYVFSGGKRHPLVREGNLLLPTSLIAQHPPAKINEQGHLEMQGGSFIDTTGATLLANSLQSSSDFTLEIVFACESVSRDSLATILSLEGEHALQGALVQYKNHCYWVISSETLLNSQLPEKNCWKLGNMESTGMQHWVLSFQNNQLCVSINGKPQSEITCSHTWSEDGITRIVLGGTPENSWHGRIAAFALYNRAFTPQERQRTLQ